MSIFKFHLHVKGVRLVVSQYWQDRDFRKVSSYLRHDEGESGAVVLHAGHPKGVIDHIAGKYHVVYVLVQCIKQKMLWSESVSWLIYKKKMT